MASGYQTTNREHSHHYRNFFWAALLPKESCSSCKSRMGWKDTKFSFPCPAFHVLLLPGLSLPEGTESSTFFFFFWPGWNPALSNSGFLNLGTVGIWNHVILCLERPMHYRMCGIIPGFYSLDANKLPPHCYDNQKCLQVLPNVLRVGWEGPQLL